MAENTLNQKLAERLEASAEKLLTTLEAAIDAEKEYSVRCPRACCNDTHGFRAKFPDIGTMLKAAQWWTEYVHGRPSAQPAKAAKPKTGGKVADLTDDELQALTEG